jgi:hypothetical protein
MATVEEVRANESVWRDQHVVVKLRDGKKIRGRLAPSVGAFYVGDKYVEEKDIQSVELT